MSGVVEKVKAKVDQVLHKDGHSTGTHTAGTHTAGTHTHTAGSTNHGPHDSNIANKADPRVDSDRDGSHNAGAAAYGPGAHHNTSGLGNTGIGSHSTNHGPHDSNLANKADPRVDSDRDGSRNAGAAAYGPGAHQTTGLGSHSTHQTTGLGSHSTNQGPHSSNLANKLDPRVDSDRDGSHNAGAAAYGPGAHHNTSGFGNTGVGSHSTNHGPHDSNLANKVDPRVDSDRDGSRNAGAAAYGPGAHHNTSGLGSTGLGSGTTGLGSHSTNHGPHDSNLANKADPRVDSDRDGSRNFGAAAHGPGGQHNTHHGAGGVLGGTGLHSGSGPAPHTAGPHKSDLLNKADPRVDSDLDGSRTVGNAQGGAVGGSGTHY